MVGDQEPSQKKPRGMGTGTPSVPGTPTELPSHSAPQPGTPRPADESAGASSDATPLEPAAAEAAAVTEEDIDE
eukprot:2375267-Amphidinium_carterae.1